MTTTEMLELESEYFRLGFAAGYEAHRDGRFTGAMALYAKAKETHVFPSSERLIDSGGFGYNPAIIAMGEFCNGVSSGLLAYSDERHAVVATEGVA